MIIVLAKGIAKMFCRLWQISFSIIVGMICFVLILVPKCCAQEPAKLETFELKRLKEGLQINIVHSKPPVSFNVEQLDYPRRLTIDFSGSKVTFRPYENIPIEIPINERGIRKIVIEEKIDFDRVPARSVVIHVDLDCVFYYDIDEQWNGQFLTLVIIPTGKSDKIIPGIGEGKKIGATPRIKKIAEIKKAEAKKVRKRLDEFTRRKRIELIRKESKGRISKVREKAKERMESGEVIEAAYKKLKAEIEVSGSLPLTREQIVEKSLYKDITMPSTVKPIVRRVRPVEKVTNLEECISVAFSKYLPLQIAKEQTKLAGLRLREARRSFYPAFLGEWNEVDGDTVTEPYRSRSYGFQAEQPIFTGGRLMATLRKEQLGESIAKGNLDRVKQELIYNVSKAYYEFVLAKNTLDIMKRAKKIQAKILEEVEKEFSIKSATLADLLSAQSLFNQVCYQVAFSERSLAITRLNMEKAMFTENLDVSNLSSHLPHRKLNVKLEECLDAAFTHRAELDVLRKSVEAAKYSQDIIRSEELPNISLVGSYGRSGEAFSQRDLNLATEWSIMGKVRWFLGGNTLETSYQKNKVIPFQITKADTTTDSQLLNAKFSFWDNLAHFTKQKEALITRKQALKDLEEMKNKIRQETEDSYYSYQRYNAQLSLAINEIGYRKKQLEIARTRRAMYEATGADVMDSELRLSQANATFQEALAGLNISIKGLNRAIGVADYFN